MLKIEKLNFAYGDLKVLWDVDLEVNLSYQPRPGDIYPIHNIKKHVSIDPK